MLSNNIIVIAILWKSESPLEIVIAFLELKGLFFIERSKINTERIQCIFKTSVFLDNVLGIVFIKEL